MALIPVAPTVTIGQDIEITSSSAQTSRTYKIDVDQGRVVGFIDGREAMMQAIYLVFETERFRYLIFSWNYGIELNAVMGKSYPVFASEIKRVIREALLADSRITDITDFVIKRIDKRTASVTFTAQTIFGDVVIERTVNNV